MKNKILYLVLFTLATVSLSAQSGKSSVTDKNYIKYAYIDEVKTYERIFDKGYMTIDTLKKIGNASYFKSDMEKAAMYYKELFAMTEDLDSAYFYRYAQSLKSIKEYDKADEIMQKFIAKNKTDSTEKL
jgi:tetratricopeptide (TPR) repeat protein